MGVIPIEWTGGGELGVSSSRYDGEIKDVSRGCDTAHFFKSMLTELLFGNGNVDIGARIRNDNSSVVEHVHSINSFKKERRLNGFLESNRGESLVRHISYYGPLKNI